MNRFTAMPIDKNQRFPVILFRMMDEDQKQCHFVDEKTGCTIYEDRPWACRMYPIGLASPKDSPVGGEDEFYFLLREEICRGHKEPREYTVREWIENEGIREYDEAGKEYKEITLHDYFEKGGELSPQQMEMFYTACYDLDKFREFVFGTSFLDRFDVSGDEVEAMREGDEALLAFGFRWLRYCLFGEPTLTVKDDRPRGPAATEDQAATEDDGAKD